MRLCFSRSGFFTTTLFVSVFMSSLFVPMQAASRASLPERHKKWLQEDVAYIITNEEKKLFVELPTDTDRDRFIDHFWEIRNPTPGAPENPYKEEHYRRLQYAIDHFSGAKGDGWKTDMGRIYITLGEPKQKARYVSQSGVRGMEIWFYDNSHPALPPFFSVIFYEKDMGDFRLYSPYMGGAQKLVKGIQGEQGRVQSVKQIDHILGREVALTTLSLIPGEPVNINTAESTMQSDLLLGTVHDLANHPFSLEQLRTRRELEEEVKHRIVLPDNFLGVMCVPLRDSAGNVRLHYALRLTQPEDFAVAKSEQQYYYSIEVLVRVLGPDGKEIFERERKISRYLPKSELDSLKGKPLGYEGWVPLAPGTYKVDFLLTNVLTKTAFTAQREMTIPQVAAQELFVTDPVAFSQAGAVDPSEADFLPFTAGGIRFRPYVVNDLALVAGQDLKFFYQVWKQSSKGQDAGTDKYPLEYVYGMPSFSGRTQTIHEELPVNQFDPNGSVVNGKKIPTTDLGTGNYRLTVSLADPLTQRKRFSTLKFNIVSDGPSGSDAWWIDDDGLAEYLTSGQADYDRGLVCLVAGDYSGAAHQFQQALSRNPGNERARAKLIDYFFKERQYSQVIKLFSQGSMTAETGESTILSVADSFDQAGNPKGAVGVVESALSLRPPSGTLYLALASYYDHLGNRERAQFFRGKGQSFLVTPAPPAAQ